MGCFSLPGFRLKTSSPVSVRLKESSTPALIMSFRYVKGMKLAMNVITMPQYRIPFLKLPLASTCEASVRVH